MCQMTAGKFAVIGLIGLLTGCASQYDDGLQKFPVTGLVTVNGEPLQRVVVICQNVDPDVKGNAARPVGHTDETGEFHLSTNGDNDGAVPGEYIVTFMRSDADYSVEGDHFHNKYTDPAKSKFRITIAAEETELRPFDLDVPPEWLAAAKESDQRAAARK